MSIFVHKNGDVMRDSALAAANFFIDIAKQNDVPLRPLKLIKLVYIARGFMLAMTDRTFLNPRFDRVEAWKYGPVIPSVYHSFKSYGNSEIEKKTVVFLSENTDTGDVEIEVPTLADSDAKQICRFVWRRYLHFTDSDLVSVLHGQGTPWAMVYEEGKNNIIPNELTRLYYKGLLRKLISNSTGNHGRE